MRAVVVYESVYGNTETVARAVADGLASAGAVTVAEVTLARFGAIPQGVVEQADLLVLGGPTHGRGMTRPGSRRSGSRDRPGIDGYAEGAREWLSEPHEHGTGDRLAAAFDTRFDRPRWLTGSAALRITQRLTADGFRLLVPPESFFVLHTEGPLRDGEPERARLWGAELARRASR